MQKIISANWIYPVDADPIEKGGLIIDNDGAILRVLTAIEVKDLAGVVHYEGILVPGFINTHCHLELSHMKGLIEEKTGLPNFIKQILVQRQQPTEEILAAMKSADEEMYQNGIVAVGDISNLLLSKSVKEQSKIYYHTFVEVFGFNRPAEPIIESGRQLKNDFLPLKASVVPHAPYSVSSSLFNEIAQITQHDDVSSIHNQETIGETELFETGTGAFANFFSDLGIAQSEAHNKGRNSLHYHLPQLAGNINTLLVHNTFSTEQDIAFAKKQHHKLFWCLCPNANIYIEDNLPEVDIFIKEDVKITLGTDSLASNHHLNILAEMQTLQQLKNVSFELLLKWATLNGALFLGIESQYGSLTVGKKPGINLVQLSTDFKILSHTTRRII